MATKDAERMVDVGDAPMKGGSMTTLFIRRPIMTSLVMIAILFFGIVAYRKLAVSDLPNCLLYTSPSPRDRQKSRMPSSA